jgi:DUF917 family protein
MAAMLSLPAHARQIQLSAELGTPVVEAGRTHRTFLKISLTGFEMSGLEERTPANVSLVLDERNPGLRSAGVIRTARPIFAGSVLVPDAAAA